MQTTHDEMPAVTGGAVPDAGPDFVHEAARDTVHDVLSDEYAVATPENVAFGYEVAGVGSRFIGAFVDTLLITTLLTLVNVFLAYMVSTYGDVSSLGAQLPQDAEQWVVGILIAAVIFLQFAIFWGYYILFEILMHGQTPGKRLAGVRVLGVDGYPAGALQVVVRNLVRIIDFIGLYGVGVLVMLMNAQARRLGDLAAGTLVVREGKTVTLDQLAARSRENGPKMPSTVNLGPSDSPGPTSGLTAVDPAPAAQPSDSAPAAQPSDPAHDALVAVYPNAGTLSAADYRLIRDVLARTAAPGGATNLAPRLAVAVAAKLGTAPPAPGQAATFLRDVAWVYQRLNP